MDEMQAIEQRLAREMLRRAGPSEPVDDAAIFATIAATRSPRWRFPSMFSAAKFVTSGVIVALFGGFLLVTQPSDRARVTTPGANDAESVSASPQPTLRESVPWGSKRIYFTPPPGWPLSPSSLDSADLSSMVEFGVQDVARVAPAVCADDDSLAEVGPTAEDLSDALANLTGQGRSGPVDVMVSGYPAKRFAIIRDMGADPPGCRCGPEGCVTIWENQDGTELGMLDGGFAIILVADVDGERLAFAGFTPGHGFYGPPGEMDLPRLEADADALAASMEIVDPDPLRAAWVTGTVSGGTGGKIGSVDTVVDAVTQSQYLWEDMRITMSDPRLSGTLSATYDQAVHTGATGDLSTFLVGSGTYRIENDAGAWEGPNLFLNEGSSGTATVSDTGILVGSGAYEGLSAFLKFDLTKNPGHVVGAIFPGEMPPSLAFE